MEENNRLEKATANGEEAEGVQPTGSQPSQGREVPTQQWEEFNPPKVVSKGVKAKKGVKIAFVCLGYALLALLAVTLVWMLVDKYVKKSPAPGAFGYSPLFVTTGSMSGTIEAGDMVIIHRQSEYAVKDIIAFVPEGATVPTTHRIVGINDDGTFITQGDANNVEDSDPVTEDMILGEVVGVIPKVGVFVRWIKEAYGWIYIVAVGALIAIGVFLFRKTRK